MHKTAFKLISISLLLSACSNTKPINILDIEPRLARMGHTDTINITLNQNTSAINVAVLPGGPYQKRDYQLPRLSKGFSLDQSRIWSTDGHRVYSLPLQHQGQPGVRIEHQDSFNLKLYGRDGEAGWASESGISIRTPGGASQQYTTDKHIQAFSFSGSHLCVVSGKHKLEVIPRNGQEKRFSMEIPPRIVISIESYLDGCAILTQYNGIDYFAVKNGTLQHQDNYTLDNPAWAITANKHRLLVANGNTGLTVLDRNSGKLRWAGSYNKLGDIRHVSGHGDYAIVADQRNTISLISLDHPGTPRLISDYRLDSEISQLRLSELQAFALSRDQLLQIDFSALATPALSHLGVNLGGTRRSFLKDDIIYVADWFSGMHLYDISIANSPRLISSLHTPGSPKGVVIRDGIAFIADDDHGLQVADVSDKRRPRLIAELPLRGLAYTMKLIGNRLYVASHWGGLHIVNVANPHRPKLLGTLDTPGKSWAVHVVGNLAYVADDDSGVLIIDVSNANKMRVVGNFTPGGHAEDIVIRDNIAYVAFFEQGLFILDLADPRRPRQLAHLTTPGNARGIQLDGDKLYLASWKAGLHIVDIANLRRPVIIGHLDTSGALWGLEQRKGIVYGLDWWGGLKSIDVSDNRNPRLIGQYQNAGQIQRIAKKDKFLYLAASQRGLQVFDGSNPLNPVWATGVDIDGRATDVVLKNNVAIVAVEEQGIAIVDVSNPFQAQWQGQLIIPRGIDSLAINGDLLLASKQDETLALIDISNHFSPKLIKYFPVTPKLIRSNSDGFLVLDTEGTLHRLSAKFSSSFVQLKPVHRFEHQIDDFIASDDGWITYSKKTGKLRRFSVKPAVALIDEFVLDNRVDGMQLVEQRLFLAQPGKGVLVINYSLDRPEIEMEYPGSHHIRRPLVSDQAIFLAGENIIVSGERLPQVHIDRQGSTINLTLSSDMPSGAYSLRLNSGSETYLEHNAFEVGFKKPAKSSFTLDDLKKIMKQGTFKGKAP